MDHRENDNVVESLGHVPHVLYTKILCSHKKGPPMLNLSAIVWIFVIGSLSEDILWGVLEIHRGRRSLLPCHFLSHGEYGSRGNENRVEGVGISQISSGPKVCLIMPKMIRCVRAFERFNSLMRVKTRVK